MMPRDDADDSTPPPIEELREFIKEEGIDAARATLCRLAEAWSETEIGAMLGPYRILAPLGEGGMGRVLLAEQTEPVRRRVAIKLIRPGMDSRSILSRFAAERQALALMDHPCIAKVFDADQTPAGDPYFVMEYVPGVPLDVHCREHDLGLTARLRLFAAICEGVQHAHQKGIVHRDLKPGNILVSAGDKEPYPRIIDFGLAKALSEQGPVRSLETSFGSPIGTLEYMSPEQAGSLTGGVDTRSDVYALGVILYEMLTDVLPLGPFDSSWDNLVEVQRRICEEDPIPPSARVGSSARGSRLASRWARQLRGDLDWITQRAMEKDPERRYATADALREDIERHLNHEAVSAGPPSMRYRFTRAVRRHRALAASVGVAVLGLVSVGAATVWQQADKNRAVAHERDLAAAEARRANAVLDYHLEMLAATDHRRLGADAKILDYLRTAAENVSGRFADDPSVAASIRRSLGQSFLQLGDAAASAVQLQAALDAIDGSTQPDDIDLLGVRVELATAVEMTGAHQRAVDLCEEPLSRLDASSPGDGSAIWEQAVTTGGRALSSLGRDADAETLVRGALQQLREAGRLGEAFVTFSGVLASVAAERGDFAEAERLGADAARVARLRLGERAPVVVDLELRNAWFALQDRRPDRAEQILAAVLPVSQEVFGPNDRMTIQCLKLLSSSCQARGDLTGRVAWERRAAAAMQALVGEGSREGLALEANLMIMEVALGDLEPALQRGHDLMNALGKLGVGMYDELRIAGSQALAKALLMRGQPDVALPFARAAAEGAVVLNGEDSKASVLNAGVVGLCLLDSAWGREARALASRALERSVQDLGRDSDVTRMFRVGLERGDITTWRGDHDARSVP